MQFPNESTEKTSHFDVTMLPTPSFHEPRSTVELQKLLIDERLRSETHKTNYQTLKEEHKKYVIKNSIH